MSMTKQQREAWEAQWPIDLADRERRDALANTDARMARVTEDILAVLEAKAALDRTELPTPSQEVVQLREDIRSGVWIPPSLRA